MTSQGGPERPLLLAKELPADALRTFLGEAADLSLNLKEVDWTKTTPDGDLIGKFALYRGGELQSDWSGIIRVTEDFFGPKLVERKSLGLFGPDKELYRLIHITTRSEDGQMTRVEIMGKLANQATASVERIAVISFLADEQLLVEGSYRPVILVDSNFDDLGQAQTTRQYDANWRLRKETLGGPNGSETSFVYDKNGRAVDLEEMRVLEQNLTGSLRRTEQIRSFPAEGGEWQPYLRILETTTQDPKDQTVGRSSVNFVPVSGSKDLWRTAGRDRERMTYDRRGRVKKKRERGHFKNPDGIELVSYDREISFRYRGRSAQARTKTESDFLHYRRHHYTWQDSSQEWVRTRSDLLPLNTRPLDFLN